MASAPGEFDMCEIVWDPYTAKYVRFKDECVPCEDDWDNGIWHIDIWTGSTIEYGGPAQIDCERELTPDEGYDVVRYGSHDHNVNSELQ